MAGLTYSPLAGAACSVQKLRAYSSRTTEVPSALSDSVRCSDTAKRIRQATQRTLLCPPGSHSSNLSDPHLWDLVDSHSRDAWVEGVGCNWEEEIGHQQNGNREALVEVVLQISYPMRYQGEISMTTLVGGDWRMMQIHAMEAMEADVSSWDPNSSWKKVH